MNVILVGLMGSGKSSVGRVLASRLDRPFLDTDALIEERAGKPIPAVFATEGEAAFRALETAVIAEAVAGDGKVIATGGGAPVGLANRAVLRSGGIIFWLEASPAELYRRALEQGLAGRPLLSGPDPLGRLAALAEARAEAYAEVSHHRIETAGRTQEEVAAAILEILKETT